MKYRILEQGGLFYPQYRRAFFPFWRNFSTWNFNRGVYYASYYNRDGANTHIIEYIEKVKLQKLAGNKTVHPFKP